jgi:hypothetical protein
VSDPEVESGIKEYIDNYYGPNSESRVAAVEKELGVPLPRSYRIFLSRFGAAFCHGHDIAGLPDTRGSDVESPFWVHVADVSKSRWIDRHGHGVDRHLVYLSDDGGDITYYLDTSAMDDEGECPVIALGPGYHGIVVGSTFLEFLAKLATADSEPLY